MLCQHENRRTALRMIAFQAIVPPAMVAPCVSALRAAEPGKPSRTAMLVLQMRALSERLVRGDHDDEMLKQRLAQFARWGEPWVFGLPIGEARAFVERRGLIVAADLGPQEITRRYLTRDDGTRLGDAAWNSAICVTRVPEKGAQRP
jgi:hypothetical protein